MRIRLTLPGLGGGGSSSAPAAPAAPPAPPTQVDASRSIAQRGGSARTGRPVAENIRNEGGGRGIGVIESTSRALKRLTGQ